jgi:uncharacterized RDD family membrane protein YckC
MAVAAVGEVISERSEQARVGRLARLAALVIDTILFSVIALVVNSVFGVTHVTSGNAFAVGSGFNYFSTATEVPWAGLTAVWLVYLIGFETVFGATPGKLLARVRVVRVDGRPLGVGSIWTRNFLKLVDSLPLFYLLGGISVLVTRNSQRVGDRWAGTTVVYRHHAFHPGETRNAGPRARVWFGAIVVALVLFTGLFNYFGRPPLVILGMFNTGIEFPTGATSYSLGSAQWGLGTISYPVTTHGPTSAADCKGTIALDWSLVGWNGSSSSFECGV